MTQPSAVRTKRPIAIPKTGDNADAHFAFRLGGTVDHTDALNS